LPVQYGDLVAVATDIIQDGEGDGEFGSSTGQIESIVGTVVELSEPVNFTLGESYVLAIRTRLGGVSGPWSVTAGATDKQVILGAPIVDDYSVGDDQEKPFYMFGVPAFKQFKVTSITPSSLEEVSVECINYDARLYQFDSLIAPDPELDPQPPEVPEAPTITGLEMRQSISSLQLADVIWNPSLGALNYVIETSLDGIEWEAHSATENTFITVVSPLVVFWVRVSARGLTQGPWVEVMETLGVPNIIPTDAENFRLLNPFTGLQCDTVWDEATLAEGYSVEVIAVFDEFTEVSLFTVIVYGNSYSFNAAEVPFLSGLGMARNFRLELTSFNAVGTSEETVDLSVVNEPPVALLGLTSTIDNETSEYIEFELSWDFSTELDISFYRTWSDEASDFIPATGNILAEGVTNSAILRITKDASGTYPNFYWNAAAVDVWGDDTNPATNQLVQGTQVTLVDDLGNTLIDGDTNTLIS
jgi:hypothetical protein